MKRHHRHDHATMLGTVRRLAPLIAIWLIAPHGLAAAEDGVEAQKARLRSLMPQVAKPSPTADQTRRGFLAYWADPTSNAYFNIPPTAEDLQRQAVIRTFSGEDEPLLLGIWGLRDMDRAAVWLDRPVFDMTVRAPEAAGGPLTLPFSMGQLEIPSWLAPDAPQPVRRERNVFFWINVHVPANAEPGTHHGQLQLTVSDNLDVYLSKPGGWANVT